MKTQLLLCISILFLISCNNNNSGNGANTSGTSPSANTSNNRTSNPIVQRNQARYNAVRQKIRTNEADIELLIMQLPTEYSDPLRQSMASIKQNDLAGFLEKERLDENNFKLLMTSIETFVGRMDKAKEFTPSPAQVKMYNDLKAKLVENRETVESFIKTTANSKNPEELASNLFLKKVLVNDIDGFLKQSVITEEEFNRSINEFNDNWGDILTGLIMAELNQKMENILKE